MEDLMTPYDLKTWRAHLHLSQAEGAKLLGVGYRTYQRFEQETILRLDLPEYLSAAAYGANVAVQDSEAMLPRLEWTSRPRFWNSRLSEAEMRRRVLFGVARHLLEFGELSGRQEISASGHVFGVTFPENCAVQGTGTSVRLQEASGIDHFDP